MTEGTAHILPGLLVAGPWLAALLVWLGRRRWPGWRDALVLTATGLVLLGVGGLVPLMAAEGRLYCSLPVMVSRLELTVDAFSLLLALVSSLLWFAVSLYSLGYLRDDPAADRYQVTSLVLLGSMLGVLFAGNLLTLYLFFETLGLVAFLFIVHQGSGPARWAAVKYLCFTLLGGFVLLGGIFLLQAQGGGWPVVGPAAGEITPPLYWAAGLLLLGFGVKAGMAPVHFWLPDAHSAAPAPASALLSGVLIKAGAYGIFRLVTTFAGGGAGEPLVAMPGLYLGTAVLGLGLLTMLLGAGLALLQSHVKRLLACSSISQMGLLLAGFGAAGVLAGDGAVAAAGGLLHIINHALFKALLFLGVGVVVWRTEEAELSRLGGLARRMPLTFAMTLVAAAGLAGLPPGNGYVSKSLVQQALKQLPSLPGPLSGELAAAAVGLASIFTVAYSVKLLFGVFLARPGVAGGLGRREEGGAVVGPQRRFGRTAPLAGEKLEAPPAMLLAMAVPTAGILILGIRPHWLLEGLMGRGLMELGMAPAGLRAFLDDYFLGAASLQTLLLTLLAGLLLFGLARWLLPGHRSPSATHVTAPGSGLGRRLTELLLPAATPITAPDADAAGTSSASPRPAAGETLGATAGEKSGARGLVDEASAWGRSGEKLAPGWQGRLWTRLGDWWWCDWGRWADRMREQPWLGRLAVLADPAVQVLLVFDRFWRWLGPFFRPHRRFREPLVRISASTWPQTLAARRQQLESCLIGQRQMVATITRLPSEKLPAGDMRRLIQRYSRDLSINTAVIFLLLLALFIAFRT
ncbi:complex I subunit 5 family protein [Desulfurivibrio dismutans]|uniref:complex I subunit 5 family protein n=1 Tax=Desulfurivibrio dismutans TaxID=1398908 RepID=UPI0023DAB8FA|nr:complex I subunit 5 family protein [Desulfurivibrio alkaliphilus]MDF1614421.1 complex I subunit 5 family protein [Desulfurivibrio alkaliphilus]